MKPASRHSSSGVTTVHTATELRAQLDTYSDHESALVERKITGQEFSVFRKGGEFRHPFSSKVLGRYEEMVAEEVTCGPDPEKHVAKIKAFLDAGYDEVYVSQIGEDQEGFLSFMKEDVLPRL